MKIGYVYQLSQGHSPQPLPKLFVTDVPNDVSADQLRGILMAHYAVGVSDPPGSNYIVDIGLEAAPAEVQHGWQSGGVETVSYAALAQRQPA
jgi:hypothetical protein